MLVYLMYSLESFQTDRREDENQIAPQMEDTDNGVWCSGPLKMTDGIQLKDEHGSDRRPSAVCRIVGFSPISGEGTRHGA